MAPGELIVSFVRALTTDTALTPTGGASARRHLDPLAVELLDGQESRLQESRNGFLPAAGET